MGKEIKYSEPSEYFDAGMKKRLREWERTHGEKNEKDDKNKKKSK